MAYALKIRKVPKKEIDKRVHEVARILEIEHLLDRRPGELSGGQRQRVAIDTPGSRTSSATRKSSPKKMRSTI